MIKKIIVFTSTRAEFGLLKPLIKKINNQEGLQIILVVSGGHLDKLQGYTINEIISEDIDVDYQIDTSLTTDVSAKIGIGIKAFTRIISESKADALLILGDRYELYSAVLPAYLNRLKIFHIGGGEETLGSLDDGIRHSISKLANYHFVATEEFKIKLMKLGETKNNIHVVGALGPHQITDLNLYDKSELEALFKFKFLEENILITFHPNSKSDDPTWELRELLSALRKFSSVNKIFTYSNLDSFGNEFNKHIKEFCDTNINSKLIGSFGYNYYLSVASHCNCVVGNLVGLLKFHL